MLYGIAMAALVLLLTDKAISYYGAVLGLLTFIQRAVGYQPTAEKVKQLRDEALARRIKELFGRH